MYPDILLEVRKPAQYIGQEWKVSRKDFVKSDIKFALCFPDLYEVGMSNLGLRIIYGILNNITDVCCERFFSPALDLEQVLRQKQREILSLESQKRLSEFDLVGFSLAYELCYTNILNLLELGGIPFQARLRDQRYPLIIAGGPCCVNPEPMAEFFDFFLIGEAEEAIVEIIELYRQYKEKFRSQKIEKSDLLFKFSQIPGVYVPSLYEVGYTHLGQIEKFSPQPKGAPLIIQKRFIRDLSQSFYPLDWLVPYIQIIHDRITLEIMRGCPNQCRFCQARQQYFPLRLRNPEDILEKAMALYRATGYEEISLAGLSLSDYPGINELLKKMLVQFKEKAVSISLPSLKVKDLVGGLASLVSCVKKTGLTFAPEVASEKLHRLINKDFSRKEFFQAIEEAYAAGYQHVKLYFLIGLPYEEKEDLEAIAEFALQTSLARKKISAYAAGVNLSINALVPKPHTPMQWFAMESLEGIKKKQDYLKEKIKQRKIKLSFHQPKMSFLEGVFSRGDRRLSKVVLAAFCQGARFDSWENHFNFAIWQAAFQQVGLDPLFYLQARQKDEFLPWDFLDLGVSKGQLVAEYDKLIANK